MRTIPALIVKYVLTLAAAYLASYFAGGVYWGLIIVLALLAAIANYVLADLIVLPVASNLVASLVDGGVAALLGFFMLARDTSLNLNTVWFVFTFALIVTGCEYFFHIYLQTQEKSTNSE
ncbi:MAG TPA: DUF2512 family protein [Oscillospiraceae bacterium]|nr:DUF2512 family protein [Oscillospiraceae bacterium]